MKKVTLAFIFSILSIFTIGQNPLPALKAYQYLTDNNQIDIAKELKKTLDEVNFTNVYFSYYKNPLFNQTFGKHKIMLFSVYYEYGLQTTVKNDDELIFKFRFDKANDKLSKLKLITKRQSNGKIISKKIAKKNYEITIDDDLITIIPKKSVLQKNDVVNIFLSIESTDINLKNLSSLNQNNDAKYYISLNQPAIFDYLIYDLDLVLLEKTESKIMLKRFAYDVSRLTEDVSVLSTTYKWEIKKGFEQNDILFPLISINLPRDIGISAEELIHNKN